MISHASIYLCNEGIISGYHIPHPAARYFIMLLSKMKGHWQINDKNIRFKNYLITKTSIAPIGYQRKSL